jgi:hypothetical protein
VVQFYQPHSHPPTTLHCLPLLLRRVPLLQFPPLSPTLGKVESDHHPD